MLFVIGGLVRSTGSGMGCPDWPKCFGQYVPPTSEAQLPDNYQDFFRTQRLKKTERFVSLLRLIGLDDQATKIEGTSDNNYIHDFNITKAYVEYVNRLWGAVTGIIVFICFLLSFKYLRTNKKVFFYTALGFIAVFFNALLGAVVVNSNLIGGIVTAHFIAAFASICFFILARHYVRPFDQNKLSKQSKIVAIILMSVISIQVILGAELREVFDMISGSLTFGEKSMTLYPTFQVHGVIGLLTFTLASFQSIRLIKSSFISKYANYITILCFTQLIFGPLALIDNFAAISKLFHISIGAGIFVLQFYICTSLIGAEKKS
jgi:cytochrome c oxidase assembly protein subunit 15